MADIISHPSRRGAPPAGDTAQLPYDLIELLFFAYRDFVRDADDLLAEFGFGRAHHRVLHFVHRNPGLRVTDLLDILKITKQSLGRVLRELIESGFVTQSEGPQDRRERLLHLTERGAGLALELSDLQSRRMLGALAVCGDGTRDAVSAFLFAMIEPEDREAVARLLARPAPERVPAKG
jgi:DNA-binding MarR family transcriptional regulator